MVRNRLFQNRNVIVFRRSRPHKPFARWAVITQRKKYSTHFVWALYTFSSGLNTRVTVFRGTPVFTDTEMIGIKGFHKYSNMFFWAHISLKLNIHSLSLLLFLVSESGSRSAPSTPPDDESDELPPIMLFILIFGATYWYYGPLFLDGNIILPSILLIFNQIIFLNRPLIEFSSSPISSTNTKSVSSASGRRAFRKTCSNRTIW